MSEERSTVDPVDDRVVHLSTHLPISVDEAFLYFTSNDLLEAWLAESANVEPEIGGRYELFWQPDDPENNSTIGCRITAFAEREMLAFQWRSPQQFKTFANGADPLTHVVVSFTSVDDAGTTTHLIHSGWRSGPKWEEARVWQERAWQAAFKQLDEVASAI